MRLQHPKPEVGQTWEWHTYLVLDEELDALDGGSGGLRDGGGDTTHCWCKSALCPLLEPTAAQRPSIVSVVPADARRADTGREDAVSRTQEVDHEGL